MFEFSLEETLDAMAYSSMVDLQHHQVTLYAVVCIGSGEEPHFSHGGHLTISAQDAIGAAEEANREMAGTEGTCRYLPASVGIDPQYILQLAELVQGTGVEE